MVLINPTSAEKNRFNKLQEEGLVPVEALNKLEAERRLGIQPAEQIGGIEKGNIGFYLTLTAIGAAIVYVYIKSPAQTITTKTVSSIYDIKDIDFKSLEECKLRGLI